ncbi:MAG TPA: acylphosphatase [Candidatus Lokiarchaeia archaeon]|nr:acylphosphatase [Candidatus Lokiarchaeia archaeon]
MRLHAFVDGNVQGVGFRWNTQHVADRLHLAGFVSNLDDGRVEVIAEGKKEALDKLLAWLSHGPRGATVSSVDHEFSDGDDGINGFSIVS